jgi:serine/threonine-protein kinase
VGSFPTEHSFEPGVVLAGTYRILRPIASGGMGEVYVAAHERLPGRFAVKVLHRDLARDQESLSRFRCEAEIMSGLRHPNIVQVVDFNVTDDGVPYLVMELVDGRDLADSLREGQQLPPEQAAHIIHQIASALEAAHARGVVHRDLKPENIMRISLDGQEDFIKVVDFGISKARRMRITAEAAILGTPQFMAPEQAQGRREEIDHRTDQFALAAMAYMLLTGREPFHGDTAVTVLYQVVHQEAEPISRYVDWPCAHVDKVLRRGMAKDRLVRYPSVLEFSRALDDAIAQDLGLQRRNTPRLRLVASTAPRAVEPGEPDWNRKTLRLDTARAKRPRVAAASLVAAAVAALSVLYLDTVGWENVGTAMGGAYQQAVAATNRTVARFRHPLPSAVISPEPKRGAEIIPLPAVVPSSPESAKGGAVAGVESSRQVVAAGAGALP